ncbi:M24 family metallopeptidase [Sandarakinorhabdus sp. AAP62]|uniref:M24 family metallopeptidase n=1 Tax=Sandarakinorhabdus sp. AAP62 TaxID=1248916 RepID=UPI00030F9DAA|nr:M24 family metallopeptidase [Sandarakinorhabdus sp. AAP62]
MKTLITALLLATATTAAAQDYQRPAVPNLRDRVAAHDRLIKARLDQVVPKIMREVGVDMWVLVSSEYNEDPVVKTMLPATWASARRTMVLIFFDRSANGGPEKGVERLAIARYPVGDIFPSLWNPEEQPEQWARVAQVIAERSPKRIAINISPTFALANGLSAGEHRQLLTALGPAAARLESHDRLALGYLETRTPEDMAVYQGIMRVAHSLIPEGLSEKVITPGVTTTQDVVWWYRERLADLRQDAWCQPSVTVQRNAGPGIVPGRQTLPENTVIMPGDLLHVDFCAGMLGLKTDTQQLAYVLRPGETDAPAGLKAGMAAANKVQDALVASFKTGATGNEVLMAARQKAIAAGTNPIIYTHSIGLHGHGAGPWIGNWEHQNPIPGRGDYRIYPDTAWSIELAALARVPEWGGAEVRFPLEVDGFWNGSSWRWIDGRQTQLHLIPRSAK